MPLSLWLSLAAVSPGPSLALVLRHTLAAEGVATTPRQAAREGLLVALGNPKLILFFVALLSQFVSPEMSVAAKALIVATAMIIDGGWYALVAVGLTHGRVLPWLQARAHWIHRITGVLLQCSKGKWTFPLPA